MCSNMKFGESNEINLAKLKKSFNLKRKNNEELDKILNEFSIFDAPQQVFDDTAEKLYR